MKYNSNRWLRALALALVAALMTAALPAPALAETYSAVVTSQRMAVAADARGRRVLGKLNRYTVVTVLAAQAGVAKIRYRGHTGYARLAEMTPVEAIAVKAVTNRFTYAFQAPDIRSARVPVGMGTPVNVLAIRGPAAMVERGGAVAYMVTSHLTLQNNGLTPADPPASQPQQPGLPPLKDAWLSGKYSNEQICYIFLRQVMGYNTAAAVGVLSNIHFESSFNPTAGGDGGTSYGICQWHSSRWTRLENFCISRGLDMNTLPAQLLYLQYELENYYPKVHRYMQGIINDAQGAYDAAYYFCYNYEGPASKVTQSIKRGTYAQETCYPMYAAL